MKNRFFQATQFNIEIENHLAENMLNEITANEMIKFVLNHIAKIIQDEILDHIKQEVFREDIVSITDLSQPIQKCIQTLSVQNIDIERPFGAVLQGYTKADEITCSMLNMKKLITELELTLTNVNEMKNNAEVMQLLKVIADLSFAYFEYLDDQHNTTFQSMKDLIWLTPEEQDARIFRAELKEEKKLALTYGISTIPEIDLISAKSGRGMNSGKAIFAGASMSTRLEIIISQYDDLTCERLRIQDLIKSNSSQDSLADLKKNLNDIDSKLITYKNKMNYYQIPLNKTDRKPLSEYAKRYETTFEKLSRKNDTQWPLLANISRSTARTLISMLDLGAFNDKEGRFDFNAAQIFANCVMSFYVYGGHHSLIEVGEIYNRLIDYVLLNSAADNHSSNLPYIVDPEIIERKMPYYFIGEYRSFLHESYADKLILLSRNKDVELGTGFKVRH